MKALYTRMKRMETIPPILCSIQFLLKHFQLCSSGKGRVEEYIIFIIPMTYQPHINFLQMASISFRPKQNLSHFLRICKLIQHIINQR